MKEQAEKIASNSWTERLARLGFAVRGILYLLTGVLTLQVVMGLGGQKIDTINQIVTLLTPNPTGNFLLVLVFLGLFGYTLWGLTRLILNPFRVGLVFRLGYLASASSHGFLLIIVFNLIRGQSVNSSSSAPQQLSTKILTTPWGGWILAFVALIWIFGGLGQILFGAKESFKKEITASSPIPRKWSLRLGRWAYIGRGLLFTLTGFFMFQAAIFVNANLAKGIADILLALKSQPIGLFLSSALSVGIILFGLYSILLAWAVKYPYDD